MKGITPHICTVLGKVSENKYGKRDSLQTVRWNLAVSTKITLRTMGREGGSSVAEPGNGDVAAAKYGDVSTERSRVIICIVSPTISCRTVPGLRRANTKLRYVMGAQSEIVSSLCLEIHMAV